MILKLRQEIASLKSPIDGEKKMKKLLFSVILLAMTFMSYSPSFAGQHKFTCYRYVNSKPTGGWIYVKATSKTEAESIAYERFKKLGGRVDYAKCRY